MKEEPHVDDRVAELRRVFDQSFAAPPSDGLEEFADLLAIRLEGDRYAIRVAEIAGLITGCRLAHLPSSAPDLLGLAGIRGGLVPVFDLSVILGYQGLGSPQWMILCRSEEPIALAFAHFEGHLRLPKSAFHAGEVERSKRLTLGHVASTDAGARAVIDLPHIVASIQDRSGRRWPQKEH